MLKLKTNHDKNTTVKREAFVLSCLTGLETCDSWDQVSSIDILWVKNML